MADGGHIHNYFKDFMGAAIINANCFGTYACMMGTQFYFCVFLFETFSLFLVHKHT